MTNQPDQSPPVTAANSTAAPTVLRRACLAAQGSLTVLVLAGVIVRLTVLDRFRWLAVLYYGTPLPLLTCGASILLCLSWLAPGRRHVQFWRYFWASATALLLLWTIAVCHDNHAAAPAPPTALRILYWNIGRGRFGYPQAFQSLRKINPDLAILGEVFELGEPDETRTRLQAELPGYDISLLGGGLVALVKGTSGVSRVYEFDRKSVFRQIDLTCRGTTLTCLAVDLESSPIVDRRGPLQRMADLANAVSDDPLVAFGDLNTPTDSVWLGPLRQKHRNAFETHGQGWLPTWPVTVPVLALDQIWCNERLTIYGCQHLTLPGSDHRPVLATVSVAVEVDDERPSSRSQAGAWERVETWSD